MKTIKTVSTTLVLGALLVGMSGCQKEGPAEKAGKSFDEATEQMGEKMEETGEAIQDAAQGDN